MTSSDPFPLSLAQQSIWFRQQLAPDGVHAHLTNPIRIYSPFDEAVFRRAVAHMAQRQQALRVRFVDVDGDPMQIVDDDLQPVVEVIDANGWTEPDIEEALRSEHLRPYDLGAAPPTRLVIFELGPSEFIMVIEQHHVATDLWSTALLGFVVLDLYRRFLAGEPAPADSTRGGDFSDIVRRDESIRSSPVASNAIDHWRPHFESWRPQLVPSDRSASTHDGVGGIAHFPLEPALLEDLTELADEHDTTLQSIVLASFQILLRRTTGSDHVTVAETRANRNTRLARVFGCCINQVPRIQRFDATTSLDEVIRDAEQASTAARPYESVPFELLRRELHTGHGDAPFFETAFSWQKTSRVVDERVTTAMALGTSGDGDDVQVGGLPACPQTIRTRSAPVALTLLGITSATQVTLAFEYQVERFDRETVDRLGRQLVTILSALVHRTTDLVDEIELVGDDEQSRHLAEWESVRRELDPDVATHHLIEQQVCATPDAIAIRCGDEQITYSTLDQRATELARRLRDQQVGPGDLVGVCVDRSIGMVVGLLAAWKCGAGYVPMDPDFPTDRLGYMVVDAKIDLIVTRTRVWERLIARSDEEARTTLLATVQIDLDGAGPAASDATGFEAASVRASDIAYAIFTSGSTGRPKGVVVEHGSVVNFLAAMAERPGIESSDVVLASTTLSFDISVLELFLPLTVGATVELIDRDVVLDPRLLAETLTRVSLAQATPTLWRMLVESGWQGHPGLTILCGGEPLPRPLADSLLERCSTLWNMYGPTETTVWSSVEKVDDRTGPVPLGHPIDNTALVILDAQHSPSADGEVGELWIGGAGVAREYINRPDLTDERFIAMDRVHPSGRLYRTGDLVRRTADHEIEFHGRVDQQIKLRGHRIELGEIETVIELSPDVLEAVTTVHEFGPGDERLVTFVRRDPLAVALDTEGLRRHTARQLPAYMVPALFVEVAEFERTANEKIDRNRLPDPTTHRRVEAPALPPAPDDTVEQVLSVYRTVFGDDTVAADADFFALGGHSLLATRIVSRLRQTFRCEVTLRHVFEHPTPIQLARVIATAPASPDGYSQDDASGPTRDRVELADGSAGDLYPLSSSQERMWFIQELRPETTAYNLTSALRVTGDIGAESIRLAFQVVVDRHTSLRSRFVVHAGRAAVIVEDLLNVSMDVIDLQHIPDVAQRRLDAVDIIERRGDETFDLSELPLFRMVAVLTGVDEFVIGVTMHHVIADQWSFGVLLAELTEILIASNEGRAPDLAPAPRSELFSEWQRGYLGSGALDEQLDYWTRNLSGLQPLNLPTDRRRPNTPTMRGATITAALPPGVLAAVHAVAERNGASDFMVGFAAFVLALHRTAGANDIAVGVPIANRHWIESERLLTSLVNTLVLRTDLSNVGTFADLLEQVRDTTLDAFAHQDLPFERLVDELAAERVANQSPLFQVLFNVQNAPVEIPTFDHTEVELVPLRRRAAQFDLSISMDLATSESVTIEYNTGLFDESTMQRFLDDYLSLLADISGPDGDRVAVRTDVAVSTKATAAPASYAKGPRRASDRSEQPRSGLERQIADAWQAALGITAIGRHDNFFELGGHSIMAVKIFAELRQMLDDAPPMSALFTAPTVASFTALVEAESWSTPWTSLVEIRPGTDGTRPFFYVSPFLISALSFHDLAASLDHPGGFMAFQPQGLESDDPVHSEVTDMAEHYVRELKSVQPTGPYLLGGHCAGAWVALEMTRQLEDEGAEVEVLVVVDVEPPGIRPPKRKWTQFITSRLLVYGANGRLIHAVKWQLGNAIQRLRARRTAGRQFAREERVRDAHREAHRRYVGGVVDTDVTFVRSEEWARLPDKNWHLEWRLLTRGDMTTETIDGAHARLLDGTGVTDLAVSLRHHLPGAE